MKKILKVCLNKPGGFGKQISDLPIRMSVPVASINFIWAVLSFPRPHEQEKILDWFTDYEQSRDYERLHLDCMVVPLARFLAKYPRSSEEQGIVFEVWRKWCVLRV